MERIKSTAAYLLAGILGVALGELHSSYILDQIVERNNFRLGYIIIQVGVVTAAIIAAMYIAYTITCRIRDRQNIYVNKRYRK